MKRSILISLVLLPYFLCAQETVKKTLDNINGKEVFYVLKSDKKVKHGSYQKFNYAGKLITEGFYKNGERDSAWTEYWTAPRIRTSGSYSNGKRIGTWQFYSSLGVLQQEYDFTNNVLIGDESVERSKNKLFKIIKGTDTIETALDRPPVYIGGRAKMQSTLIKGFHYPKEMFSTNENVIGDIEIGFVVSKDGKAENFKIINGVGHGLDREVLRLSKQISEGWLPGIYKGETVATEMTTTVSFRMLAGQSL